MQTLTRLPNFIGRAGPIARRTASVRSPMPAASRRGFGGAARDVEARGA